MSIPESHSIQQPQPPVDIGRLPWLAASIEQCVPQVAAACKFFDPSCLTPILFPLCFSHAIHALFSGGFDIQSATLRYVKKRGAEIPLTCSRFKTISQILERKDAFNEASRGFDMQSATLRYVKKRRAEISLACSRFKTIFETTTNDLSLFSPFDLLLSQMPTRLGVTQRKAYLFSPVEERRMSNE